MYFVIAAYGAYRKSRVHEYFECALGRGLLSILVDGGGVHADAHKSSAIDGVQKHSPISTTNYLLRTNTNKNFSAVCNTKHTQNRKVYKY